MRTISTPVRHQELGIRCEHVAHVSKPGDLSAFTLIQVRGASCSPTLAPGPVRVRGRAQSENRRLVELAVQEEIVLLASA